MDISALPDERLEAEMMQGAAQIAAATSRWLEVVGEFDRRELAGGWGCRSTAHCLNFACGMSLRTGYDHVRLARRLPELPLVAASFAAGEISYSKARAISRIATPQSEPHLLEAARSASASQLERLVACRELVTRNQAQEVEAKREFFSSTDPDGAFVFSGRLSAEEGEVLRAAMAVHKASLNAAATGAADEELCSAEHSDASERSAEHNDDLCSAEHKPPRPSPADVFMAVITTALVAGPTAIEDGEPVQVVLHVEEATMAAWLESGTAVCSDTARRLSCAATVLPMLEREGEPLKLGRSTKTPSRAQRRALRRRDGGCRFPGCTMRRYVQAHHIIHWIDEGPTDLDNLVLLCSHHHHLVHEGGWSMTGPADHLEIRRPNGTLLDCCAPSIRATGPTIAEQNDQLGLRITARTSELLGYTYHPNYDEAIRALLDAERQPVSSS